MDLFEGNKRGGLKDGSSGALRGTRGDPTNQEYQDNFEKGRFIYETNKYGKTAAMVFKADRDLGRKISEKKEKPKEYEPPSRKAEPLFTCPCCDEEFDGYYCLNCGYDTDDDDDYYSSPPQKETEPEEKEEEETEVSLEPNFYRREQKVSKPIYKDTGDYYRRAGIKPTEGISAAAYILGLICVFFAIIYIIFIWNTNTGGKGASTGKRTQTEVIAETLPTPEMTEEDLESENIVIVEE